MRAWWVALLVVPALSGCADDGGGLLAEVFGQKQALDGPCGHAYEARWDQQIIMQVRLGANASRIIDVDDLVISASHYDGNSMQGYDRDRRPDSEGCVAFPLRGDGGYFFLGLAFREGSSHCYAKGQLGGSYDGSFDVAEGVMLVQQQGRC
jgi:hypothetical protein